MGVVEVLKPHNLEAYQEINVLLGSGIKKIAIPRATGSGKTYIMGALAEQFNDDKKLVLEPTRPLLNSIKEKFDEFDIANTDFITYQKLIRMSDEDIAAMDYKLIFLDEFHHGTAPVWGMKIDYLMKTHSDSIIFGTSATTVRNDGVNVVETLFDNNAIEELSLSTAIARKVLPCPHYITAIYRIDDEFEKLKKRIGDSANSKAEKKEFYRKMQEMKLHFEKSYGIPLILNKYIKVRNGKYLVFCKDKKHLNAMRDVVINWFQTTGVKDIHSYAVYSDYPDKERDYEEFCDDNSDSAKILFSINMLNEGLHIEDISGVLMLRTTKSNLVYLQQLGRLLEAGNMDKYLLVFDFVNNFSCVNDGVGLLQEIKDAIAREKESDSDFDDSGFEDIDTYFVLDQILDVQEMFREIEGRLTGSWENGLKRFDKYVREHDGDVLVPTNYRDKDGFLIGGWVNDRRKEFRTGKMDANRIAELNIRGFVWNTLEYNFENNIQALKQYKEREGDCLVPKNYIEVVNGKEINLGQWCGNLRMTNRGKQRHTLTKERIEKLENLGFIWDIKELNDLKWEENFKKLCRYKNEHGHLFQIKDKQLSKWCTAQRQKMQKSKRTNEYKMKISPLEEWKIEKLNSIGFCWESLDEAFLYQLEELKKYYETHNKFLMINRNENKKLSIWCTKIRDDMRNGRLEAWKVEKLNEIGFPFDPNKAYFEAGCRYYADYISKNGQISVPKGYKTADGFNLDSWVSSQKNKYRRNVLTDDEKKRLNQVGFCFSINNDNFDKKIELLIEYMHVNCCDSNIPQTTVYKGEKLGTFVSSMRSNYKNGSISDYRKKKLQSIGFIWDVREKQWNDSLNWFKENKNNHGGIICIPKNDISVKYYYDWLVTQKLSYRKGEMREDRRKLFEQVIMS